jgi:hypothetical protein
LNRVLLYIRHWHYNHDLIFKSSSCFVSHI